MKVNGTLRGLIEALELLVQDFDERDLLAGVAVGGEEIQADLDFGRD